MATESDIPVPVCEARGDQVGTIVDNIIKISVSQLSQEKQTQDDKHNEIPIVEGENFLKSPSDVEVHCEVTPEIRKDIEESDQTVKEGMDTLLLSTKDTSSDHNGTSDPFIEKIEQPKVILQETSLPGEETESHAPYISEREELNVQMKTIDDKSADEKPTEEDTSPNLTNMVASKQEGLKIEGSVEENFNTSAEKASHENIITPGEMVTKEVDEELKEAELFEKEQSTTCTLVNEDKQIENHAESLHVDPENSGVPDLSQENSIDSLPEEQSRDVTPHGNTTREEEATIDADIENKESLESFPTIVSSSHEEGSTNAILQEGTSDHMDGKTIIEVDKHQEGLEQSSSSGEAHCDVTYVSPDVSKSTENTDQTMKDGSDTLLLSSKLSDQPVESAANEETSAEEVHQPAEEVNSTDKPVEPEQHNKDSSVLTSEIDGHDKDDTKVLSQLSNDTSSDHRSINDSSTENVAVSEEKLQEINLPSEQFLSNAPCSSKGEELNILVETADNKSVGEEAAEEDMSCNLTNGVSKGESDQNEMTSEQDGLQDNHRLDGKIIDEVNKQHEVLEQNLSSGEAHSEANNFSPDVSKNTEESDSTDKDVVPEQCINDSPDVTSEIDGRSVDEAKVMTQLSKDTSSDNHITNDPTTEKASHESIITPGEAITKEMDGELEEAELSENERSTTCTLVNEDKHIENHAEPLHVGTESTDSTPEEQSRDVTLHGNTTEEEEAAIDADNEHKKSLESFPPIASSSHEEGSVKAVLQEGTSDHTDGKTIAEVNKHQEGLESSSSDEAHCEVTYVSSDFSKSTESTDQTMKDGTDTLLLSPKLSDQPLESAANEETSAEEIQHAEEVNSTGKDVEPEKHSTDSSVLTSEIDDHDKDDTRVVTQLSNDTSSDHRSINDSSTENVAINEEKLQEINLPGEEILTNAPRISKGEELNILVETKDNKPVDGEATEEDMSCNLTNGVSKEGGSDQNEMTSAQDGLQNNHHMDEIDKVNEHQEVLENLSSGEAHSVNNFSPDVSKNAEESDSTEKDVVPEQCINDPPVVTSEIDDPEVDEATVMTQLSQDTSSDDHVTNGSSTENAAVTEEMVQETNLSNEEIGPDVACISEAEELNVQVKTTDNKYGDEKPTEEAISCDLTHEVSEKEEVGQDKMTSEQEIMEKERSAEDKFNNSADEQSTSGETITTLETSNCDELQSKNILLSKEEETTVAEGDGSVTASEDTGVTSGNTLSHGDVECQSTTLEDEEHKVAEFSESKQSPRCTPAKEDVQIENPAESLHADLENVEVPNSSQEKKTEVLPEEETLDAADSQDGHESFPSIVSGSLEEENVNAVLQEVTSDHTNRIIDEVDKKEGATENPSTAVSTEDAEGNSLSKLDHSENKREDDSVKACEEVPLPLPLAREVGDVPTYLHEAQIEDGAPEKGEDTENLLLKTESRIENTEDEHANSEHTKASDLVNKRSEGGTVDVTEEKEETLENFPAIVLNEKVEENSYIEVDQKMENIEHLNKENESDEIEETAVDAAKTNEKTQEQNVSNEDSDKDLSVEVDATEMKHDSNLEEEHERPSLSEASKEDLNDDKSIILPEPKTDLSKVEVPADEESTDSTTSEKESLQLEDHTASTSSADIEEPCSLTDKTIDATDKELTLENVSTEIPREHTEENLVAQVDFTESEQDEHLEKDNQDSSSTKALESEHIDELNHRCEDSIKPDMETGGNTETTSVKEETDVEKPIDLLQVKPEDIKQQDSSADINSSMEEQFSITDPQEISIDNTERESLETAQRNEECVEIKDVAKDIPVPDKEDSIQIEEVGSPNPLNEALEGNANNDESTKITQDCLIKEGESPESMQVAAQDIETPPLIQDRELSSFDGHNPISPEGTMEDIKEEIADNATGLVGESPKDKDISVPNGESEENSPNEVDGLQKPSSEEVFTEKIDNDEPTTEHEVKLANEDAVKDNLSENEAKTECVSVEEEVQNDFLQVADEDIKDNSSAQYREASHLEEQEPTTHSHGAKGDQEDAETLDLKDPKEETLEDKNHEPTPHKDTNEDSLQVDGPILEEKEPEKDSETTPLTDAPKDDILERTVVREVTQVENSIHSSQVASEATEVVAPCQDTERSFNVEHIQDSEDISGNEVEEKINNATGEEPQEAQDLAKSVTHEEDSPNEQNIEAALENEDLSTELPQVADEDTEEPCLSEVRETSSQEEQILSASPGVLISDNKEEKPIELTVLQKEIPKNEETSLKVEEHPCAKDLNVSKDIIGHSLEASNDNQHESSITEVFEEHTVTSNEHVSESTSMESEVSGKNNDQAVGEASSCGDKTDSEKTGVIDDGSSAVTTSETLEETDPSLCTETEVQVPHEEKEAEVINQETENDENIREALPNDASEDVSESKEVNGEEEMDSNYYKELTSSPISVPPKEVFTPLTDAPKDDIIEKNLVREVTQVENSIDSSQVASEATKVVAPCQDTERSFNVEQILDSEDISSNEVTEKITDATGEETEEAQDLAKSVTHEDNSPNERNIEAALENEDLSAELPQVADKDTEEPCLSEVRETSSQEEQILSTSPGALINDNEENKAIEPTVLQKEIPKDEETSLTAEEHPCAEDLNVSKDITGHNLEASNDNQQESSITEVFEEHTVTSNEHVSESTSMESEVSGGDKTDLEKTGVIDDGSSAVTSETLEETEVQVPHEEKEAEVINQEAENDENVKEALPNDASEDVSESKEVDAGEETDSNTCRELTSSPVSVPSEEVSTSNMALEEHSTSNSSQEPRTETREGAETEQDQNQEPALQVSELIQDSPVERIERDTHPSPASANDSAITEKVKENKIETTDCKESDEGNAAQKEAYEEKTPDSMAIVEETSSVTYLETKNGEEAPEIEETIPTPSSAEETSNSAGSLAEENSDSNEAATMAIENKSGDDSINQNLEAIAQGCELISTTEEEKLEADAEIKLDEVEKEEIQGEITRETEILKGDSLSTKEEQSPRVENVSTEIDEAVENVLHLEDRVTSNEEPTIDIDNEKANELDIAFVQTDTRAKEEEVFKAVIPGRESGEHNKNDEISGSDLDEVQAKDEEVLKLSKEKSEEEAKETHEEAYVEAENPDFASQTKEISEHAINDDSQDIIVDSENSTTINKFLKEDYPNKSRECEVPSAIEDVVTEKTSLEETIVIAEVHEEKAGIALEDVVPKAAGFESNEVEEANDKCVEMADIFATVENSAGSTSKVIPELIEGIQLVAEYQETELHRLPEELDTKDFEVKKAEIDDVVNIQSIKDISGECKESSEAAGSEKPVEGDPEQKIETNEVLETKPIQNALVSETVKQETEEQQRERGIEDVHEEEKNTYNIIPKQLESSYGAESEKVSEPIVHQTSIGGLHSDDASAQRDKHVVVEAGDTKNLNPENLDGKLSSKISRGEHEIVQLPKLEREIEECRNEDGTHHEVKAKPESKETSPIADHSSAEKELTSHIEDMQGEKTDEAEHENSKTDEERENEEESSHEHDKSDLSSEAPVMVDMGDADVKVTPKKSHNILSGVGSKVKHSIAKVKKAITGKSSHPKTPSPSKVVN